LGEVLILAMGKKHRHFWRLVGEKGGRWRSGHALARCTRCPSWTVVEYEDKKPGPCQHAVAREKKA